MRLPQPQKIGEFDSALEFRWDQVLRSLSLSPKHHPGSIPLPGGERYEPDFLLGPHLLEVKGDHNERIHKPRLAQEHYQRPVIILRRGIIASDDQEVEYAVWDCSWALRESHGFVPASEARPGDYISGDAYFRIPQEKIIEWGLGPLDFPHQSAYTKDHERNQSTSPEDRSHSLRG